jgi:tRNA pseudouridine38-40 synthase
VETVRLRLDLAYDGTAFSGWGRQPGLRTVQGVVEDALAILLRHPQPVVRLVVAGRTDAGVHATGQVAHIDVHVDQWRALGAARRRGSVEQSMARRLNGIISGTSVDVLVAEVSIAPRGFDARFSPLWRHYEYRIADATSERDPRRRTHTLWHTGRLDAAVMDAAAASLTGLHDFAAFCKPRPGSTTVRTLLTFGWTRDEHGVLVAEVRADAFCHSMVRSLVGGSLAVGLGALEQQHLTSIMRGAVKANAFAVVPAKGLTLIKVAYPADDELEARAELTRARRVSTGPSLYASD